MNNLGYRVIVTGVVQGVCFRYFTSKEAHKLNITGHAKNLNNGNVEVQMFGEKAQLQTLIYWLQKGPERAIVEKIKVDEIECLYKINFISI